MKRHKLVGPSRAGDQFHYHWAARQCLALLPGSSDLVTVSIEGVSGKESSKPIPEGDEVIDVGLYYGDEAIDRARRLRYVQLKHSTRHASKPSTAGSLQKTIRGFALRYEELRKRFAFSDLRDRLRFEYTTNRPIAQAVSEALDDLAQGTSARHPKESRTLLGYCKLGPGLAAEFFQLLFVEADVPDVWAQRNLLAQDMAMFLAEADYDAPVQLKELVTRKAMAEDDADRVIRRRDVLHALKVDESDLQPAPRQMVAVNEMLPREQEPQILAVLFASDRPLVIHADGGVGKSMLALRLASAMPSGSQSVLYDCFGDGLYRSALSFRHRPEDALVQIANELAARGLCNPLIPTSHADAKHYLRAFCGRLQQTVNLLRAREPEATLCIIIDAADNAELAAQEMGERGFVRDLIRTPLPNGVRLALTCRTHRQDLLDPPPDVNRIQLSPFSPVETASHLRGWFPAATATEVEEFHYLSSANPRVQALALASGVGLADMLRTLGPEPTTVDKAIGHLLQRAMDKLKDRAGRVESAQIDLICCGLAVLRPLVPIETLARISGTSESAVRSFALDLDRPLLVKGDSLHFLDEPTETWFRDNFKPSPKELGTFIEVLRPLAAESSYVASTLPQLLLSAGRMDELVALALSSDDLPTSNPIERRDVELQRLLFALKACLSQRRRLDAAKLALKAGGEVAAESRQIKVLQENTHLAAVLLAADRLEEIVARRTFSATWMGSHHIYNAGLLSGRAEFSADANSRLRMAWDWLSAWAQQADEQGQPDVDDDDRTEFAMVLLRLRGADAAANFLRRWTARHLSFATGKKLGARLVDLSQYDQIDLLAHAAGNDVWLILGLADSVSHVGHDLPAGPLKRLMHLLADRRVQLEDNRRWTHNHEVLFAVQAAVVQAAKIRPTEAIRYADILKRYLPTEPPSYLADGLGFDREPLLRAYAVEAALRGRKLVAADVAPAKIREQLLERSARGRSHDADSFELTIGGVLPWFVLSAEIALGRVPEDLLDRFATAAASSGQAESRDYHQRHNFRQTAALEWVRSLCRAAATDAAAFAAFHAWAQRGGRPLGSHTLTVMARLAARTPGMEGRALEWASMAYDLLEGIREDAEVRTTAYLDLARAVLPASSKEAAAYFSRSVEIASRIGDENLDRWSALLRLARSAAQLEQPRPRSAYRLSRVAELTYEYLVRDKYFDWDQTAEALADLCGPSSLAILSRWRDRRFGRAAELLPVVVYRLMARSLLPNTTPVALAGLRAEWEAVRDLQRIVNTDAEQETKRMYTGIAYRYLRVESQPLATWESLAGLARNLDMGLPDLDRLLVLNRSQRPVHSADAKAEDVASAARPAHLPDWDALFNGVDLLDSASLRAAYAKARTYDGFNRYEVFFREAVRRTEPGQVPELVAAAAAWPDFDTFELRYLLGAVMETTSHLVSLRSAIREATLSVCRHRPSHVRRRGWGGDSLFDQLDADGILPEHVAAQAALDSYATNIESLGAGALFHMVQLLASHLTADHADEALHFGFDLLEDVLRPDDGDGTWAAVLQPPADVIEALAGYVWAGLGSPRLAERWEFAHVVRTWVELGQTDALEALRSRVTNASPLPFVDAGLVFYSWHARQWLLIGLARGALERPSALQSWLPYLRGCLSESHVLVRAIAAAVLREVQAVVPETNEAIAAEAVNSSPFPVEEYTGWRDPHPDAEAPDETGLSEDEQYSFGIDIGPYWFAPLGNVFGVTEAAIAKYARRALRERLNVRTRASREDARHKRKIFDDGETHHSHGSVPATDDLRSYHAYHALMFVAAELLKTRPVRKRADDELDEFQDWLGKYLLTRSDGRWISDRRDPRLALDSTQPEPSLDRERCWLVSAEDLNAQLRTDDGLHVLWGYWHGKDEHIGESVRVRSALVSRVGAESLLAALQTAPDLDRFALPDADEYESLTFGSLQLSGWVLWEREISGADDDDPWAGKISYPGPAPDDTTVSSLGLSKHSDGRRWTAPPDVLLRSESWAHHVGYGREQEDLQGTRLSANVAFLRRLLETHPEERLIVSVAVRRRPPRHQRNDDSFSAYPQSYTRYYLLDSDGIARTL